MSQQLGEDVGVVKVLTAKDIKSTTKDYSLENIGIFSFSSHGLEQYGDLLQCSNLIELRLSKNRLSGDLQKIAPLKFLKVLDLSQNCITSWKGVSKLKHLVTLELYGNRIIQLENIEELGHGCLNRFSLSDVGGEFKNPVCEVVLDYATVICQKVLTIKVFDGRRINSPGDEFFTEALALTKSIAQVHQDADAIKQRIDLQSTSLIQNNADVAVSQASLDFDGLLQLCKDDIQSVTNAMKVGKLTLGPNGDDDTDQVQSNSDTSESNRDTSESNRDTAAEEHHDSDGDTAAADSGVRKDVFLTNPI